MVFGQVQSTASQAPFASPASGTPCSTQITSALQAGGRIEISPDCGMNFDANNGLTFKDGAPGQYCVATIGGVSDPFYQTCHNLGFEQLAGGVYSWNGKTYHKSDAVNLNLQSAFHSVAQHWGLFQTFNNYSSGEGVPIGIAQTAYGGYIASGQEADEGLRIEQAQPGSLDGTKTDGSGGIWKASVKGKDANVVSFNSILPGNTRTLGESRLIRDLDSAYATGKIASIVCSGSPSTCTVTGTGTNWTSIRGFVGPHTIHSGPPAGSTDIISNNLTICLTGYANDGYDYCLPVTDGISATSLTLNPTNSGTGGNAYLPYGGSYVIYGSAWPTGVNVANSTFSAADVSGITNGHTVDQVLAYNQTFIGIQLIQHRHLGKPGGVNAGINLTNLSTPTSPQLGIGFGVTGNYKCAYCEFAGDSGVSSVGLLFNDDPGNVAIALGAVNTGTPVVLQAYNSKGDVRNLITYARSADQFKLANGSFTIDVPTGGITGPVKAPSGGCATSGVWVFSQDGHASFCASGKWITKI